MGVGMHKMNLTARVSGTANRVLEHTNTMWFGALVIGLWLFIATHRLLHGEYVRGLFYLAGALFFAQIARRRHGN